MAGLRPAHVPDKPVQVFCGEELPQLERVCAGRTFQQRREAAIIAIFEATGVYMRVPFAPPPSSNGKISESRYFSSLRSQPSRYCGFCSIPRCSQ